MFERKKLIYSAVVIIAVLLAVSALTANNKKDTATAQAEQKSETVISNLETSNPSKEEPTSSDLTESTEKKENEITIHTYTIKSGDTIESIASTYKVKVATIAESNNISMDTELKEGQTIEFPSIDGVLYKIQNGETLWDLALLNKIDFNKIVEVNKLEAPEKLKLGQKIIMPDVEKVKPVASKVVASNKTLSRGGSITASISASLPVKGKISSKYGPRWGREHAGIDIAAPTGTNVFASMAGKVSFSGWHGGYGNLIIIDHGNGLQTYYAHNSKLLVRKGQTVDKGTHIAEVGSTGNSTGPHSHFEIRKNGTPVNPYNYLK